MLKELAKYIVPDSPDFVYMLILLCVVIGLTSGVITIIKHII